MSKNSLVHVRPILCGRAEDLKEAATRFAASSGGLVLTGPAGIGKTMLSTEMLASLESSGRSSVRLRCAAASSDLPLAVLAPVLPIDLDSTASGLPSLMVARRALIDAGRGQPVVIGVDDLHLLDEVTALLLSQMIDGGEACLLGTYRSGEFVARPLADLWHRGVVDRMTVGPMDRSGVAQMAETFAGRPLDDASADRLMRLCAGNALHAAVILRAAKETGALRVSNADSTWSLGEIEGSPSLVDFVEAELSSLDDERRRALELVALGEPSSLAEIETLAGHSAVAELEEGGLVVVVLDGRRQSIRLRHPLYGEVVRARLSRARARFVYRDLAAMLAKTDGRRRDDVLRMAFWSVEGGNKPDDGVLIPAAHAALFRARQRSRRAPGPPLVRTVLVICCCANPFGYLLEHRARP